MFNLHDDNEFEPEHTGSVTDQVATDLQLYGYRPFHDEPDTRPAPESEELDGVISDVFAALTFTFRDTRLEPDLTDLLWSAVNLFHRAVDRVQRKLDENEDAQKRAQKEQDGSEIRSVELETLLAHGQALLDRRDAMEQLRDTAAERYEQQLGTVWRPFVGSMVNHRSLTSAVIDSRDYLNAKRRSETE